ncbi:MAG: prepilin-type N-terminal cleavage/methylation domain-containing protein [Verrucomicrobiales bacterium]|nr:prepilin-type N-terminal cleavage/methylation domain-containing protein [Verrucomicrobiales bacterium]
MPPLRPSRSLLGTAGFTLIELILVMAILVVALGVTFPALKRFFQGRVLDAEARRLLALTRYGQSRAVSEGIPMILWIDERSGRYGLEPASGFALDDDGLAREYKLDDDLTLEADTDRRASMRSGFGQVNVQSATTVTVPEPTLRAPTVSQQGSRLAGVERIGFRPDGSIDPDSPTRITLRQGELETTWLVQATNRLAYELRSEEPL